MHVILKASLDVLSKVIIASKEKYSGPLPARIWLMLGN